MNKSIRIEKKAFSRRLHGSRKHGHIARNPQNARKDRPVFVKSFNPYPGFYRTFKKRWGLLAKVDPIHY